MKSIALVLFFLAGVANAATLRVGPKQAFHTVAAAASAARNGDIVEIESGDYRGDVAVWLQSNLTLRGVGRTRPRMIAAGASAEGKAIWVLRNGVFNISNIEFRDASVQDHNGAGIRFEQGQLTIRNCKFENNENGILTNNIASMRLDIQNSEFGHNGYGDGYSHNLYVGNIGWLSVTGSYFHHARVGHLLKSRAAENHITYNRLTDEAGGQASYEIDLPNGGLAYVMGNLIEQSATTENSSIISYGAEGYGTGSNELYLVNNTIVDSRPTKGNILNAYAGLQRLLAQNNILVTSRTFSTDAPGEFNNNPNAGLKNFVQPAQYDFHLRSGSPLRNLSWLPLTANGVKMSPKREYAHPAASIAIPKGTPRVVGAFQKRAP